ncbi:DNA binding domain-containing protein, excisionase family, partial [Ectothiorhodospira magna]
MSTGKAAKRLGVSVKTLQRWDREGRLVPAA